MDFALRNLTSGWKRCSGSVATWARRTSPFGLLCSSSSYGPAFPRSPSRTLHVDIDNKKDTPFGVSFFVNQRILMYPSSLSYTGCSSLWVLLPKTLRDELRDSLQFIPRFAPINWVLCGPGQGLVGLYMLVYIIKETHLLVCLFLLNQRLPIPARIAATMHA